MEFKQIKERLNTLLLTMIIASCMFLLSACGGGGDSTPNDSKTDTGALSFQVVYHSAAGHRQPQAAVIDCAGEGVSTVEAAVYAPDDAPLKSAGPWDCEIGKGTISSVPAGGDRTVVILGKDGDGDVVFRGEKSDIQVNADSENTAGTIDCYGFVTSLQAPTDGSVVNANAMGLAWNAVAGATEYHVLVSESSNPSDPIIDEFATIENYTPAGLSNGRTYYWKVITGDAYDNTGIESQVWSFTVDAQHQNTPPVAQITRPDPNSEFSTDDAIAFAGNGSDDEDGELSNHSLAWRSDIDGPIGTGVEFASDALSEGTHQITLTAIDSEGATGTAGVTITVSDSGPGQCLGNEDPDTACSTCLPGWTDVDGDHCSTLVRYVDIDNHGSADLDGLTWSAALIAVQDGIDTCQTALQDNPDESHCEVWVAEGIYYIYQTARHNSVQLRTGVHLFGGFSGTETHRDQRNWSEHMTTLDGHKNADSSERVEHVVLCKDEGLIDGFIITRGSNSCDDVYIGGAGMYNTAGSRPVVRNTIFRNNKVECGTGGGVFNDENSISTLINCAFDNNESESGGGLFVAGGAVLRAESCVFQDNLAWSGGGAVMTLGTQTVFIQCQFISNTGNTGGAIYSSGQTELEVDGCLFSNNSYNAELGMPYGGGALRLLQTHATIRNSGFVNNKYSYPSDSQPYGAAVNSTGPGGTLDIVNSYFHGNMTEFQNEATIPGSTINSIDNQRLTLINCTIFQNQFVNENPDNAIGGGLYSENTPASITNCIIRDNIPGQVNSNNSDATRITYSNVAGISIYHVQDHNIDQPVYFAGNADLHLLPHDPNDETVRNPCIDAGNGDVAPATDFDGNPRVDDPQTPTTGSGTPGYVDMGAFEYQP